jgi:hypothetical protein
MGNQLTKKERDHVTNLLIKYENVFTFSMKDLRRCKTMSLSINLTDETPIYWKRHRLKNHEWELVDERCKELHEAGIIQPSSFDFATAIVMREKKDLARLWTEKRMWEDYRPLNLVTPQDKYPMPIPEELFDNIRDLHIHNCGFEARLQPNCACYEVSQENNIPWEQQVVGMTCDAFCIEECTHILSTNHGLGS